MIGEGFVQQTVQILSFALVDSQRVVQGMYWIIRRALAHRLTYLLMVIVKARLHERIHLLMSRASEERDDARSELTYQFLGQVQR
jgi:hypothetical protein